MKIRGVHWGTPVENSKKGQTSAKWTRACHCSRPERKRCFGELTTVVRTSLFMAYRADYDPLPSPNERSQPRRSPDSVSKSQTSLVFVAVEDYRAFAQRCNGDACLGKEEPGDMGHTVAK